MHIQPTTGSDAVVYVVDDDPDLRQRLQRMFELSGLAGEFYGSPGEFLESFNPDRPACVLLGMWLPGMTGLELQAMLRAKGHRVPVIMLTPSPDVSLAVRAMKAGAVEVFQKPPAEHLVIEAIWRAISLHTRVRAAQSVQKASAEKLERLSRRQREILELIVAGRSSKSIAEHLGLSRKTVENHRSGLMRRLGVRGLVELVRVRLQFDRQLQGTVGPRGGSAVADPAPDRPNSRTV